MENKKFYVTIKGKRIEVTEEVYRAYVRPVRKEQRQKRRERRCKIPGPTGNLIRCQKKCEECPYAKAGNLPKGTMLSLEAAEEEGMEIADKNTDIEAEVIETETMAEEIDALYKAISKLTPRQQKIVKMYYFEGKTQEEIGRYYGITQQAVRNALGKILAHLKKIF